MSYVDGYVLAVPTANREAYKKMAETAGPIFLEHGATKVFECWGDDVPDGEVTSFPMAVKCKEDETVVLGWIKWPTKEARDAGMEKAMKDERLANAEMPFDGKRMIFGGFEIMAEF
jgi:uncharacterized protein YbaA (DUF1428 family)